MKNIKNFVEFISEKGFTIPMPDRYKRQSSETLYKCDHCGNLLPKDELKCSSCGAPRKQQTSASLNHKMRGNREDL